MTTGISRRRPRADDRGRDRSSKSKDEIVTPGHVFPLVARDGGVLVRTGHTEAAVDVARLAGLNPSGVICEIMNEDGTMARMDDLVAFAQLHNLKIGTIRDLIAYRRRHDHLVEKRAEAKFTSRWGGEWTALTYLEQGDRHRTDRAGQGQGRSGQADAGADARAVDLRRYLRRGLASAPSCSSGRWR